MSQQHVAAEPPAGLVARGRSPIVGLVRAVPIRWPILSIAALNSAVVLVLPAIIWYRPQGIRSARDDVLTVRGCDEVPALLVRCNAPEALPALPRPPHPLLLSPVRGVAAEGPPQYRDDGEDDPSDVRPRR